jgi:hypothetical protein
VHCTPLRSCDCVCIFEARSRWVQIEKNLGAPVDERSMMGKSGNSFEVSLCPRLNFDIVEERRHGLLTHENFPSIRVPATSTAHAKRMLDPASAGRNRWCRNCSPAPPPSTRDSNCLTASSSVIIAVKTLHDQK